MTLADKITEERKKAGLSQEELADRLSVSRQAVSKWECGQSCPDLQNIIAMSELFGVSTDYLLKDISIPENKSAEPGSSLRKLSGEECSRFLSAMRKQSKLSAAGVFLCIFSPVILILLVGLAQGEVGGVTEMPAVAVGLTALFLSIAIAVFLFIRGGSLTSRYSDLTVEEFELSYGVSEEIREKRDLYQPTYIGFLSTGIILCVLSPLPLIIGVLLHRSDVLTVCLTALLLTIVAVGVCMIVCTSNKMAGYHILLQEGSYRKAEKQKDALSSTVSTFYWCLALAVYLTWSFISGKWDYTWIVWPIAGVVCAPVMMIVRLCKPKSKN